MENNIKVIMLNRIIQFSLHRPFIIVALTLLVLGSGVAALRHLPIDVLPNLNRPRVTIMTECSGFAPEEVETRITNPLETAINGASGIMSMRSNSTAGLSIITIEFDWGTDIFKARQTISERLQLAKENLPEGILPQLTPISSVMGQIAVLAVWSDSDTPMELRTLADWTIRPRLLALKGVSEVFVMGGDLKQYQVLVNMEDLRKYDVTLSDIETALRESNQNVTGGYFTSGQRQRLIRSVGRIQTVSDIENLVIKAKSDPPLRLKYVAKVEEKPAIPVGDALISQSNEKCKNAVVLTIEKQPDFDTPALTKSLEDEIKAINKLLQKEHPDFRFKSFYQQETFIKLATDNVIEALWMGALLVVAVMILFLMNIRITLISLAAIPVSLLMTCLVFAGFGYSINTMTLGGIAVAIGELVDDAIVDAENIFRRLRENALSGKPRRTLDVVFEASSEIRNSIVFGTIIVVLVFLPLFYLPGINGRLFQPLGTAYVVSILSSLAVSLTLTPVMANYLLPSSVKKDRKEGGFLLSIVQQLAERCIRFSLRFPRFVTVAPFAVAVSVIAFFWFVWERDFIPEFNEGAVQVNVDLMPGVSIETTRNLAEKLTEQIQSVAGVQSVVARIGRAERDEHAVPVSTVELVCRVDSKQRSFKDIAAEIRKLISPDNIPGTTAFLDQPLQHLISHIQSGTSAKIAVKVRGKRGTPLKDLNDAATQIKTHLADIPDANAHRIVPNPMSIPQIRIDLNREKLAQYGLTPLQVNQTIETALNGTVITEIVDFKQQQFEVLLRLNDDIKTDINRLDDLTLTLPSGGIIPLVAVADINKNAIGPMQIDHEAGLRQVIVQSSPAKRGSSDVAEDIKNKLIEFDRADYDIIYDGSFNSEKQASNTMLLIFCGVSLPCILLLLREMFRSFNLSLQIMGALPLALLGGIAAIMLSEQKCTVPCLVGLISVCGIAARNGILLIDHYRHLVKYESETISKQMLIRAGKDRVAPVLMTALTSGIGLLPLIWADNTPGREILYPIATVVVGGLITSTAMEFFVRPAMFYLWGRKALEKNINDETH
ncbi:multidrug transporter AcrB [Planctomycetales bacterium]|nr:multidrug transporter AcrB [Planctomycetales bacterium]